MMFGTVENRFLVWRATVVVCQDSGKNRVLDVRARLFGGYSGAACSTCWNYFETEARLWYYVDLKFAGVVQSNVYGKSRYILIGYSYLCSIEAFY